jgi:hypothetical protein
MRVAEGDGGSPPGIARAAGPGARDLIVSVHVPPAAANEEGHMALMNAEVYDAALRVTVGQLVD